MESHYWNVWKRQLIRWDMNPFVCDFLRYARPILPLVSQLLVVGLPLVKPLSIGTHYQALIETLADDMRLAQLTNFLGDVER